MAAVHYGAAVPLRAVQIRTERVAAEALIAQTHRDGAASSD